MGNVVDRVLRPIKLNIEPCSSVMVAGSSPSADFTGVVGGVSVNATFPQVRVHRNPTSV